MRIVLKISISKKNMRQKKSSLFEQQSCNSGRFSLFERKYFLIITSEHQQRQ